MSNTWSQIDQLRKHKLTPLIIALIFFLLILLSAWQLVKHFEPTKLKPQAPLIKGPITTPHIADLHLMGVYDIATADIPVTQLQLTLQGTVVFVDDPAQSRALILSPGQPAKVYKIGDFVPGNAKVEKIDYHSVVLEDGGQLQKLRMPLDVLPHIQLTDKD